MAENWRNSKEAVKGEVISLRVSSADPLGSAIDWPTIIAKRVRRSSNRSVILDSANAEAISQLTADQGWESIGAVSFEGASLAGIVELARTAYSSGKSAQGAALRKFDPSGKPHALLHQCFEYWSGAFDCARDRDHIFSAPEIELWCVRSWDCINDDSFPLYLQRFERSLRSSGFGDRFPKALSQAFTEMIENVIRHSSTNGTPFPGVAGFHVRPKAASFVVADLGQGVLRGLRGNPRWRYLADEQTALVAAARDGASRMVNESAGFGFKRVFKSFLEREGYVSLRSGDGVANMRGNSDQKSVETCSCAYVPGLRVSVTMSLEAKLGEIRIGA